MRWPVRLVGVVMMVAGLVAVWQLVDVARTQGQEVARQEQGWRDLVEAAAGPATGASPTPGASPSPDSTCQDCYLRLTVVRLQRSMVAIDADWNGLHRAPMVHYHTSPAPGQQGNVLVAFHREYAWRDIDQVHAGDTVILQTRDRASFTYVVDFVRVVHPSDVSLLQPTTGHDLTLITCDPWLRDYNRMIFRLHLMP